MEVDICSNELRSRLETESEKQRSAGNSALADLLEEAGNELEEAIGLLDEFFSAKAVAFVQRHSTPQPSAGIFKEEDHEPNAIKNA